MAGARFVEKSMDGFEREFFGFAGDPYAAEVHVRGAVDHTKPFASGGHAVVRLGAPLPRAFESFIARAGENE